MSKQNIGYMLHHLSAVLARNSDQVLQEQLGIGFSQFKILMIVQEASGVQQKVLAQKLGQTEASISRQIKLLTDEGLVMSQVSPSNRRQHLTYLTSRGSRVTEKAVDILNNYHAPVFARLSDKQQHLLQELLGDLHGAMCQNEH